MSDQPTVLLSIRNLTVAFSGADALYGVDIDVRAGQTLGIVGESGSGKSLTWLAAFGLLGGAADVSGSVRLDGEELLAAPSSRLEQVRGRRVAMVFQNATEALNPLRSVGWQVGEALRRHRKLSGAALDAEIVRLFGMVGLPDPARLVSAYAHQLSGGQNQRVMIAMALAANPDVLIADEPTTALDVTTQAQILEMLQRIKRETGMALVLISHDLAVVAQMCDRVAVMYAGHVVEVGPAEALLTQPVHPYTFGLLEAMPKLDGPREALVPISGTQLYGEAMPQGCVFSGRCMFATPACTYQQTLRAVGNDRMVACIRVGAGA